MIPSIHGSRKLRNRKTFTECHCYCLARGLGRPERLRCLFTFPGRRRGLPPGTLPTVLWSMYSSRTNRNQNCTYHARFPLLRTVTRPSVWIFSLLRCPRDARRWKPPGVKLENRLPIQQDEIVLTLAFGVLSVPDPCILHDVGIVAGE